MYLVRLPDDHPVQWLFLHADPARCKCPFEAEGSVEYADEASMEAARPDGCDMNRYILGRSASRPRSYKRFIRNGARIEPEYQRLEGAAMSLPDWTTYAAAVRRRRGSQTVAAESQNQKELA